MANINYIASAGTGKTYTLIEEVKKKIEEGTSLKNILILTFTQKAAEEIKERLRNRLFQDIEKNPSLYREILNIERSNIGTFHSIFLKILKKYPDITGIDNSVDILTWQLELFFEKVFEEWIEIDYSKNEGEWEKLVEIIDRYSLRKTFEVLYLNRIRLKEENEDGSLEKKLNEKKEKLLKIIDEFYEKYKRILDKVEKNHFRNDLNEIKSLLKENNIISYKIEEPPTKRGLKSFIFKDSIPIEIKNLLKEDSLFREIDKKIHQYTKEIQELTFLLNYQILIKKFYQFSEFFQKRKEEEGYIDFNDILEKTNKLLEKEEIAEELRRSFKFIFIDEFQDSDILQLEIIQKIANNNIYVFGDPKQCIYEWRDANLQSYFSFLTKNSFLDKTLDKNWRSCKNLVDFFNELFTKYQLLSHIDSFSPKYRQPLKATKKQEGEVKIFCLNREKNSLEEEAKFCINLIETLKKEGHQYKDIMILFRRNNSIKQFSKLLVEKGIPVETVASENLFEEKEIKLIINILEYINTSDPMLFFKILTSPILNFSFKEIYKNKNNLEDIPHQLLNTLKNLKENHFHMSLEEILERILENSYIESFFSIYSEQAKQNIKKLKYIVNLLSQEGYTISDFLEYIKNADISTPILEETNSVKLMTIHSAKGLESPVVILPLISSEPYHTVFSPREISVFDNKVAINLSKAKNRHFLKYKEEIVESIKNEEERLFYVAVTRAKEKLYFISSKCDFNKKKKSNKTFKYIDFLVEIFPKEKYQNLWEDIAEIKDIQAKKKIFTPDKNLIKKVKEIQKRLKDKYETSLNNEIFTSVTKILEKNQETEKEKQTSLEITKEKAIYIGILVHEILEEIDIKNFSYKTAKEKVYEKLEKIPEEIRQEILEETLKILSRFENSKIYSFIKETDILAKELSFTLKEKDKYIEGRIDLVCKKDNQIIIIDFKTNRYKGKKDIEKLKQLYRNQKIYYEKAIKKVFHKKDILFALALLQNGDLVFY